MKHSLSDHAGVETDYLALGELAEEIKAGLKAGRQPDVAALAERYPDLADQISQLVPALVVLHGLGQANEALQGNGSTSDPGFTPGGQLGDYRILREIGRGGMGVVYEAEQLSLRRRVALKVLPFAATLDTKYLQRFKNEAQAAAYLHHTHIVPVYAVGTDRGVHFYAMQYIEGQTLAEVIRELRQLAGKRDTEPRKEGPKVEPTECVTTVAGAGPRNPTIAGNPLSLTFHAPAAFFRAVAQLGVQAAEALEHAHQIGVVHRDIKPGNLLVDAKGHLWITDFGLARCRTEQALTLSGDLLGTLRYMSPEQTLAKRALIDHRSDIYSLGVTLYEVLTLEPAYPGIDREELLREIALSDPRSPRRIKATIPVELETIVLKAMAKEPERRYATSGELADDLRRFLEHRPIQAVPPTLRERLSKWSHRHKSFVGAGAVAAALAAVGLVVGSILVWREKEQTKAALAEARSNHRRAEANFERALSGAMQLMLRLEDAQWEAVPHIKDLRRDVDNQGLEFYRGFVNEQSPDPAVRFESARAYGFMATIYWYQKEVAQAKEMMHRAIALLEELATASPTEPLFRKELARMCWCLGSVCHSAKQPREAEKAFRETIEQYRLAVAFDTDGEIVNTFAWFLLVCPDVQFRDPERAVGLARQSLARFPEKSEYWNTLGIAYYRAEDLPAAAEALKKSTQLNDGDFAYNWFYLAMTSWRLGDHQQARAYYNKGAQWLENNAPRRQELTPCQSEAAALLGIKDTSTTSKVP